ncbi:MAG: aldo/keto reductase [Candidatus Competibacteraceae bacterium]
MRRLGTDYIDHFQLHGFDAATPVEETLRTLDDLVTAGKKLRCVGCSNFLRLAPDEVLGGRGAYTAKTLRGASGVLFAGGAGNTSGN